MKISHRETAGPFRELFHVDGKLEGGKPGD